MTTCWDDNGVSLVGHLTMAAPVMESHPGFIEEIDASEMDLKDVSRIL